MKNLLFGLLSIFIVSAIFLGGHTQKSSAASEGKSIEPITLSYSAPGPATVFQSKLMQRMFDDITSASNGKITIKTYYGGALLAPGATYDGILTGVADIGYDQPSYSKGRFPIIEIMEQPWGYPDVIAANNISWSVFEKFQPAELKDAIILGIYSFGHPVLITNKPIRTLEDLAPLKIRGTGNMALMIKSLGAAAVAMPIMEVYDALHKGTVDGCLVGPECIPNFNLNEVGKYATDVSFIGPNMLGLLFMSKKRYNKLSPQVQQILNDQAEKYKAIVNEELEAYTLSSYDYAREHGMEVITVEPEEQSRWREKMQQLTTKFIADKEAKGIPAQEIVSYIQTRIKDYLK